MSFFRQIQWIFFCLVAVLVMSTPSFPEDAHLEVAAERKVAVDGGFHISLLSETPTDPEEGDLCYDMETKNLLFFKDSVRNKVTFLANEWEYSDWSDCSATCGGGTQARTAVCTRADGVEVPESYCGDEPVVSKECNTQGCLECPAYVQYETCRMGVYCTGYSDDVGIYWNGSLVATGVPYTNPGPIDAGGFTNQIIL